MPTLRRFAYLFACAALSACGSSNSGHNSLTKVTPSTVDATCTAGGVTITSGVDVNGNGTLDDSEVTSTNELCNGGGSAGTTGMTGMAGTTGASSLFNTTVLPAGDPNCPGGGVQIDSGLDNGSGGGTAGDGVLQTGEITSTKYVCNGTLPSFPGSTKPPEAPAGAFKIDTSGGNSTTSNGGSGGHVQLNMANGTLGGGVKIFNTGVVDATFTVPTAPAFQAGATPMAITMDTPLNVYADTATGITATDAFFQVTNDRNLYANVAGVAKPVTSISVPAGKTLTLALNANGATSASVTVTADVQNAGTITTARQTDAKSGGSLSLAASSFYGAATSSIALSGLAAAGSTGGAGGYLDLEVGAHLYNAGTINTSGGNGDDGGQAGYVYMYVYPGDLYNTAAITARGGTGGVGGGGDGNHIDLESGYNAFANSGALDSSGGAGVTAGGTAGYQDLYVDDLGSNHNTGALTAKGGTCSATNCGGGSGAFVELYAYSGDLRSSGDIDTSGASGAGTGAGGSGGRIRFYNYVDTNYTGNVNLATGSTWISGNLTSKGGSGASAGSGGFIYVYLDPSDQPQGEEITLLGYTSITTAGGNGTAGSGGSGGYVQLTNSYATMLGGRTYGPGGAVINYANIDTHGGAGDQGGQGGRFSMSTQTRYSFNSPYEIAQSFSATVDTHGGSSTAASANGGYAGYFRMTGIAGAENRANVTATGGTASGAGGNGQGVSGTCYIHSDYGPAINSGTFAISGGAATSGVGGDAGELDIYGSQAQNSAALTANGGNGATNGGSGGTIILNSSPNGPSKSTGAFSVSGGTGTTAGSKGTVTVDGSNVTP